MKDTTLIESDTAAKIDNIYIPKDIQECFIELDNMLPKKEKKLFLNRTKEDAIANMHFTTGTWIRNNWGLRNHSRLKKYFYLKGIYNPEQMSSTILGFYYDWLKKENSAWRQWSQN